jgi:hypothetical protein
MSGLSLNLEGKFQITDEQIEVIATAIMEELDNEQAYLIVKRIMNSWKEV